VQDLSPTRKGQGVSLSPFSEPPTKRAAVSNDLLESDSTPIALLTQGS
jgi:hypothetical protein